MIPRILITDTARSLIDQLRTQHGQLIFHQSGGCCDGSAPMCFPAEEFFTNESDVCLGQIHGCDFFMARDQFEYWKHTQLKLNVTPGRGSSFSLEIPLGYRFIIESRLFEMEELLQLEPIN